MRNLSTNSHYIVFDNPDIQKIYNALQNEWNEAYNYIRENYSTTAPNGSQHLTGEGFEKMLELGKSPHDQIIDHFRKNGNDYKVVERKSSVIPTITQD